MYKKHFLIAINLLIAVSVKGQVVKTDSLSVQQKPKIQLALLLDTSKSMDGLINQARALLWKMVDELTNASRDSIQPIVEIALYEYGHSRLDIMEGFVRQVTPLTTDLDLVSDELFKLRTSGGSEYCGWAIQDAVQDLSWSADTSDLRLIVIAGNESFFQGEVKFRAACQAASAKNILINTVFCGSYKQGIRELWKEGADLANGKYMSINQDEKVFYYDTPFDDRIIELNRLFNATYLPYGPVGHEGKARQLLQDTNAASFGNAYMRNRIRYKINRAYYNGVWDLVDAVGRNPDKIKELATIDLPGVMVQMPFEEKVAYVARQAHQRELLRAQIAEEIEKARKHIRQMRNTASGRQTLDYVMLDTVIQQAKDRRFVFEKD